MLIHYSLGGAGDPGRQAKDETCCSFLFGWEVPLARIKHLTQVDGIKLNPPKYFACTAEISKR